MKYQKATVSIINLGNEDILTCSGEQYTGCNYNWNHTSYTGFGTTKTKPRYTSFWGGFWGWFHW